VLVYATISKLLILQCVCLSCASQLHHINVVRSLQYRGEIPTCLNTFVGDNLYELAVFAGYLLGSVRGSFCTSTSTSQSRHLVMTVELVSSKQNVFAVFWCKNVEAVYK